MTDRAWPPHPIGKHATQAYSDIAGAPAANPAEFLPPVIHPATRNVDSIVTEVSTGQRRSESVYLVKTGAPQQAYRLIPKTVKRPVPIIRCGDRWGQVLFCVMLQRERHEGDGFVFCEPDASSQDSVVAVKKLRKAVVNRYVARGCAENPYKEIAAMQQIADGVHVLGCIEALEDDTYLYIVMPLCDGGDVFDLIHPQEERARPSSGLPERHARDCFRQILQCLHYVQSRGVAHLDISPENIMIRNGQCIFIDLGCCLKVPTTSDGTRRVLISSPGRPFGKIPYLPPEVPLNRDFDGFSVDLWSLGITLFHMVVGEVLDRSPFWSLIHPNLFSFMSQSERLKDITRHQNGVVFNLLNHMLQREPASRPTLEQVMRNMWVGSTLAIPHVPIEHYIEQ